MEVTVEHLGEVQFEIRARQHTIASDQPEQNGGFDEAMTPLELMLASLGACAGYYAAQYLRKKGLASEGTLVRVSADKKTGPARLDDFRVEIDLPVACGPEHRKAVEDAVHHCPIHNTLEHPPKIMIAIKDGPMAKAA